MEFAVVGWPPDGPALELDHRRFSYAGKFVMTTTGKAVAREDGAVVGAVAFNADRTDGTVGWVRYVTIRADRRGQGIGARLLAFVTARLRAERYERVRIAVNNPYAYHACYKAGFGYTGQRTGVAELVLEAPFETADAETYRSGLAVYAGRELDPEESAFVDEKLAAGPPERVPVPTRS